MIGYESIKSTLYEDIKDSVIEHRKIFTDIIQSRYYEMIPGLIKYSGMDNTSINPYYLEYNLMKGYNIVVGSDVNGNIQILGHVRKKYYDNLLNDISYNTPLTHKDITFIIPEKMRLNNMLEISYQNNCDIGNFVVVRNKMIEYKSDFDIINYYSRELAELAVSRYSLAIQSKLITIFRGNENDISIDNLVSDLFNGSPIVKVGNNFDVDERFIHVNSENIPSIFSELKREYQNVISELNIMLGINSLGVDKESGVSNTEALSNIPLASSIANIKLSSREDAFSRLNKRYKLNIKPYYNNTVQSEMLKVNWSENYGEK